LLRRIDAHRRAKLDWRAISTGGLDRELLAPWEALGQDAGKAGQVEGFLSAEPERCGRLIGEELQRQNPHAHEVRAVNPLVALRDHGAHAPSPGTLRRPVARRPGAALLPGAHGERVAGGL